MSMVGCVVMGVWSGCSEAGSRVAIGGLGWTGIQNAARVARHWGELCCAGNEDIITASQVLCH